MLRRHWGLLLLVIIATALRVLAVVAIRPGTWFSDSNVYVETAATGTLSTIRPVGYSLFVAPFYWLGSASALIVVQHLLGVGLVVALYALLIRRGAPRWVALLGALPAAVDLYLVVVEHVIMAETVFHAALLGTFALLLWKPEPGPVALAAAGALLAYAGLVRSVGAPVFAVFVVYLVARRVGWRRVGLFVAGGAVVTLGYMTVFDAQHGTFGVSASGGQFLYGKVAPFADCAGVPAGERFLCPDPDHRLTPNEYVWSKRSPVYGHESDPRVRAFATRTVRHQFGDYVDLVAAGFVHYFRSGHDIGPDDYPIEPWQFPEDPQLVDYPGYRGPIRPGIAARQRKHPITEPNRYVARMVGTPRFSVRTSAFLHRLQGHLYTPGPVFACCVLLVLVALVVRRARAADAALVAATALTGLAVSQALSVFSYRYGFGLIILLPFAAALALTALLTRGEPAPR